MNKPPGSAYDERVAAAVAHAQQTVAAAERELIEVFIREYYRQIDPEDLLLRSPDDLAGAALSHWELGRVRTPGVPRLRVFSPSGSTMSRLRQVARCPRSSCIVASTNSSLASAGQPVY